MALGGRLRALGGRLRGRLRARARLAAARSPAAAPRSRRGGGRSHAAPPSAPCMSSEVAGRRPSITSATELAAARQPLLGALAQVLDRLDQVVERALGAPSGCARPSRAWPRPSLDGVAEVCRQLGHLRSGRGIQPPTIVRRPCRSSTKSARTTSGRPPSWPSGSCCRAIRGGRSRWPRRCSRRRPRCSTTRADYGATPASRRRRRAAHRAGHRHGRPERGDRLRGADRARRHAAGPDRHLRRADPRARARDAARRRVGPARGRHERGARRRRLRSRPTRNCSTRLVAAGARPATIASSDLFYDPRDEAAAVDRAAARSPWRWRRPRSSRSPHAAASRPPACSGSSTRRRRTARGD